ncbi:MAG: A/G-specific adenine glycosylase [Bacteroidetes bacterium]|nr:A/G-specific adenine glycosylase [Bacteroidota bacterium]
MDKTKFGQTLLKWNREKNKRQMPWKGERDPYYVWLSEIILQQTRVEQGLPYYLKFKAAFPDVKSLALAKEDEVMKLWQGLGYYSRARNLHESAKYIHERLGDKFPDTFVEIKKLKGIGDYTAAAISSFVFGEKRAVVDGNVIRVLARYFGIQTAFDTTKGKKEFAVLAQKLIDERYPGEYNQAIMDFGAVVCTPQKPKCTDCPFKKTCVALLKNKIASLPKKGKKIEIKDRYFNYLLIRSSKEIFIQKRVGNDIWKGLYELPLIESPKPLRANIQKEVLKWMRANNYTIASISESITQRLSHRNIHFQFVEIEVKNFRSFAAQEAQKVRIVDLHRFAFPKTIDLYLAKNI